MNKLKIRFRAIIIFLVLVTAGCIKDGLNTPPGAVTLTAPLNAESQVILGDSLIWQEAIDPDGDLVKYDVYLGTEADPKTVVSTRQEGTSYMPELIPGTSYYWKIIAHDGAEGISESDVWSFTTLNPNHPPASFNLISPNNGATDHLYIDFLLEWNPSTDPDGDAVIYDVLLSTNANPTTVISANQTGTTYGPTLSNGTTYYWKVVAKDGKGGKIESAVWSFTTRNYDPGEINLTAPDDAEPGVALNAILTWDAPSDQDGDTLTYDVYFETNASPSTIVSSGQTSTTYAPGLTENTTYYWKIVAHDGKGGTGYSPVWSFTTLSPNNPPDAFNLISPGNGSTDNLYIDFLLEWNPSTDPDGDAVTYDVILSTNTNPTTVISADQTGTTYGPTLTNGTTYYWKVVAKDGKGGTRESAVWSFTTRNYDPGEINLTAPDDAEPGVALDASLIWDAPSDQDGDALTYDVYFGTNASPSTIVSSGQTSTTYAPGLTENTTYYWKIVAHDGKGGMGYSPVWSFTTLSPNQIPGSFRLTSPSDKAINVPVGTPLTWGTSTDPDGDNVSYDVYFGNDTGAKTKVSDGQAGTSFSPILLRGYTYYWRVVAKDDKGGTRESATWSFSTLPAS